MARKKRDVKIPASYFIKCPHCSKRTPIFLSPNSKLYLAFCKRCHKKIETPTAQCCLICAFSNKKCPTSLINESKKKNSK